MLMLTSVAGNVLEGGYTPGQIEGFERLKIPRHDMEKSRLRGRTDGGTDVGLDLESGVRNGDVLECGEKSVLIEQLPEKIASVRPQKNDADSLVLLGHVIGNLHRPISIRDGIVSFPIQADSELEVFEKLLARIGRMEISAGEGVFCPHEGAGVHGHG